MKLLFQAEAGIVGNTSDPGNQTNFGQLFTDKSNRPVLNQVLFGVARDYPRPWRRRLFLTGHLMVPGRRWAPPP